jgi:hypothetical protein
MENQDEKWSNKDWVVPAIAVALLTVVLLLFILSRSKEAESAPPSESEIPAIHLFSEKGYQGEKITLIPGMRALLAEHKVGSWQFLWNSMRVSPGIKLVFARDAGGGHTARGYATGHKDVVDIEAYMRSVPSIGTNYSIDTGVGLERDFGGVYQPVYLMVVSDADWKAMQQETHNACLRTIQAWNQSSPGRYQTSYCDKSNPASLSQTITL